MAVPYNGGVPEVAPDARPPDDYQHIRADASSFGGAIATGLKEFGAGASKAGHFFGEVAADEGANQFQEATNKILHGDSSKTVPGPDGTMQPDLGYLGLKGRAALDARPATEKAIEDQLKSIREGLTTPEQILKFDNFSRRYRSYAVGQIGTHADNQANTWYAQVNDASGRLALTHIAANADNPEQVAAGASDLISARVKQAQLKGGGPELVSQAIASAKADALKAQVDAIAINDPVRAMRILDNNRTIAGADYPAIAGHLRARVDQVRGHEVADYVLGRSPVNVDSVHGAIIGQESGGNPNVRTSTDNAKGPGQILDSTFARYAKPGESITNPADNLAVSKRIVADYYQKYDGDPARIAVAYFSGPGNVAPPGSPTPWKEDRKDGNGASTSGYVAGIMKRLGGAAGPVAQPGGALPDKADAYERVLAATADQPNVQTAAIARMNQTYSVYHQDENKYAAAFKARLDDSLTEAWNTGAVQTPMTVDEFNRRYGATDGPKQYDLYQSNVRFGADYASVATMNDADQERVLAKWTPEPGENYVARLKRQDELRTTIGRVREERAIDPAGFALKRIPGIAQAYREMHAVEQNPTATDPQKRAARTGYVNTLLAAQERIGIPEDAQTPMTREEAMDVSAPLRRMLPGQEQEVLGALAKELEDRYGDNADKAFSYALQVNKLNKETAQAAARLMKKLGMGGLDSPTTLPATPEARRLSDVSEVAAAQAAVQGDSADEFIRNYSQFGETSVPDFAPRPAQKEKEKGQNIPSGAIQFLRSNPATAKQFDLMYGAGTAQKIFEKYPPRSQP